MITIGLMVFGAATAGESIHRLVVGERTVGPLAGIVIAGLSALVLAVLAWRKRAIAPRAGSAALAADGWVSAVGSALATVTLLGTAVSRVLSWTWADPGAATMVAAGAVLLGIVLRRSARSPAAG